MTTYNPNRTISVDARQAFITALEESAAPLTDQQLVLYQQTLAQQAERHQEEKTARLERAKRSARKKDDSLKSLLFLDEQYLQCYDRNPQYLQPCLSMYQYLAPDEEKLQATDFHENGSTRSKYLVSRLQMNIPDTIVNTESGTVVLYTDASGYLCKTSNFSSKEMVSRFTHDAPLIPSLLEGPDGVPLPPTPEQLAAESYISAVVKTPGRSKGMNDLALLTTKDVKSLIEAKLDEGNTNIGAFAIQKFVRPHGAYACLYRTVWMPANEKVLGKGWTYVMTNRLKLEDDTESVAMKALNKPLRMTISPANQTNANKNLNIVKQTGKAAEDMLLLTGHISIHLSRTLNISFKELVCDFVKDHFGRITFLQVKAFLLVNLGIPRPVPPHTKGTALARRPVSAMNQTKMTSRCACCKRFLDVVVLRFQMTTGMIADFKRHLETHGGRSEHSVYLLTMMTRGHTFGAEASSSTAGTGGAIAPLINPGPFGVCESCFEVYQAIAQLRKSAKEFARLIGVPQKKWNKKMAGQMGSDLEAEDGYRIRTNVGRVTNHAEKKVTLSASSSTASTAMVPLDYKHGTSPISSSAASGLMTSRSRASTATSILTHSSVIPTTKSTLLTHQSSSTSRQSSIEPEVTLNGLQTPNGHSLNVKVEHVEVSPETMAPAQLRVCRFFVYFDHVGNIPTHLPSATSSMPFGASDAPPMDEVLSGQVGFDLFERETKVDFLCSPPARVQVKDLLETNHESESKEQTPAATSLPSNLPTNVIFLNKFAIFYFFATKETFEGFLDRNLTVELSLRCKDGSGHLRPAGQVELNLRQFANPLVYAFSYQKVFSTTDSMIESDLASLKMTVGAVLGENIDTNLVNLRPYSSGVFIPDNTSFYTCDPLPNEWVSILPDVAARNQRLEAKKAVSKDQFADFWALSHPVMDRPPSSAASRPVSSMGMIQMHHPTPPPAHPKPKMIRHYLVVQVHAVYCLKVKYPLVIEFTLFGQHYTIHQKQSFRLNAASSSSPPDGPNSRPTSPTSPTLGIQSKVILFDSDEKVLVPKDLEDQLPTYITLQLKEVQPTNTTESALVKKRRSSGSGSSGAATTPAPQPTRGSWSVTVNISEIKSGLGHSSLKSSSTSDPSALSRLEQFGSTGGAIEGTFDLVSPLKLDDHSREAPYVSLAIRYQ